jgi:glycerophosphoryl diester phosphodiesterase
VELVRAKGLVNQVVVQSFDWDYLRAYHALEPAQVLAALGPPAPKDGRKLTDDEKMLSDAWCEQIEALGARVVAWNRQVDRKAVRAAHRRGLKVWVYTINDARTAHDLLDAGVDGIITDNPTFLWKVLASRAR